MLILGIETSCDETAACVLEAKDGHFSVRSNIVSSQIKLHARWGGVVPNLAAREHLKNILPVIDQALKTANIEPDELDLIAVTQGPGLIPALLVGMTTAKTLSYLWQKPFIGIQHIEGHIYANFISDKISSIPKKQISNFQKNVKTEIEFPILALVVSGGHTQLVLMKKHLHYEIIGETVDDAVGEAFDKVARILGLGYPGGPLVSRLADGYGPEKNRFSLNLPRPMMKTKDFNFSFSGIKTAVLYAARKQEAYLSDPDFVAEICQEFQTAVCDVLVAKTIRAAKKFNPRTIILAGGVSANQALRQRLGEAIAQELKGVRYALPEIEYSVDNAAMIAAAGYFRWESLNETERSQLKNNWQELEADPNLKMD